MLDPWAVPRFVAMCIRMGVRRFGWKTIIIGWVLATILAIWLNYHY